MILCRKTTDRVKVYFSRPVFTLLYLEGELALLRAGQVRLAWVALVQ